MRKIIHILLILLSFRGLVIGQVENLSNEKSKDKVVIGGQVYYVHIVKEGETLYSLSKLYNVSQKNIAKENPEVFLGIQVGQALKIPVKVNDDEDIEGLENNEYIFHRVKRGQTLYSLSKKYNISQEDILTCNPEIRYGLNVNQVVKIPRSEDVVDAIQKYPMVKIPSDTVRVPEQFIYHEVKQGETLYSLARLYNISNDLLVQYNPFLIEGLKMGQTLKVPKPGNVEITTVLSRAQEVVSDSVVVKKTRLLSYYDTLDYPICEKVQLKKDEHFNIALLLPFYLERNNEEYLNDSTGYNDSKEKNSEKGPRNPYYIYPKSLNFIEFYEGFLLSVDSLKKQGLSVKLYVYDTRNDTNRIKEILRYPEMQNLDLIIGPVYAQEIKVVSGFSKARGIKMVSPLLDNPEQTYKNPHMFQVYPSNNAQLDEFSRYVSKFADKNLVLVHSGDSLRYKSIKMVKEKIFAYISMDTIINNIRFKEVAFRDSVHVLEHALVKNNENIFIVPSNEEAFVAVVLTKLNTLKSYGNSIKVIGLSRWQKFNTIDPEYLFNLGLSITAPFFVDYHDLDVRGFIFKYRKTFNTEPGNMAIHGYDVGFYFLSALMNYGQQFENCLPHFRVDLLQADYRFIRWEEGSGFENVAIDILDYNPGFDISRCCKDNQQQGRVSYNVQ